MSNKKLLQLIIPALAGGVMLTLCGNNPYHQKDAAGLLRMQDCLECHNIKMGKPVSICIGDDCLYSKNHSVMRHYPPIGKEKDYAPASEIESAGSFLEEGKITCLSCHDLTKPPPHLIREGDKLCLICHKSMNSR
ncbi:MAG: hypothetical protein A2079_03510 [Geobacteraceae bacterium GWC2_48_7]|nr:MAG: hypothetical protein A2079_03510 [Geobacteraceae bacterium GWC2_48_7]